MKLFFDAETGKQLQEPSIGGLSGFVSWKRLASLFAQAGETTAKESVAIWQVDERGITFKLK